jgi:beta-aspartyl-peptidase (threonine type)
MRAVLVHGGAGDHAGGCSREAKLAGARAAAAAGWAVLAEGGSALAAVEAATRVLEEDPCFDAGVGSYLNLEGEIELDAIIMDGGTLTFGAVAAVQRVKHPVTLARRVMVETPHALLVGRGAERYAVECGLCVPDEEIIAPAALAKWHAARAAEAAPAGRATGDTVGAVALDAGGGVAAATSTGGTHLKWPGRVGDSPIVGAGAYADNDSGAVSCTGHGESILRICMAHTACLRLAAGEPAAAAARRAIELLERRTGGQGGLIVVDRAGGLGWASNTAAMPVAWRSEAGQGEVM